MTDIQITQLKNGLRVITDHVPSISSVAMGAWIASGTRNEDLTYNGAAHMLEHMLFKGTKNRNAVQIAEDIENVGGSMNAYTSREITSYHMHLLKDDIALAADVLADMVQHSTLPDDEIERERHVILQEIGMSHDTPDDLIFDEYYECAYPDQGLGAPILGRPNIIKAMGREPLFDYMKTHYCPPRMVISAAGAVDHDEFVALIEEKFQDLPDGGDDGFTSAQYQGGDHRMEKDLEQAHIILGFEGLPKTHEDFYGVQALSNVLGGSMSSRLFQEVREKRGLVYSIFSFHYSYRDAGQFGIYAGTGPDDLAELVPVVCDELIGIGENLKEDELDRAKTQMKAGLLMGRESMMTRADQQAKYLLQRDKVLNPDKLVQEIENIDLERIKNCARKIFSSKPTLAALGPLSQLEDYNSVSDRIGY